MSGKALIVGAIALLWYQVGAQEQTISDSSLDCNNAAPNSGVYQITSQDDADRLKACQSVNGTILISSSVTNIYLQGVVDINGSLVVRDSPNLVTISGDNLTNINGNFTISDLPNFTTFAFEQLTNLSGGIFWDNLPAFKGVSGYAKPLAVSSKNVAYGLRGFDGEKVVSITNTQLSNTTFLDFSRISQGHIEIRDNPVLATINFDGMRVGGTLLHISGNSPNMELEFPDMRAAGDLIIEDVYNVDFPVLLETVGNLTLSNNWFAELTIPRLQTIGNCFNLVDNGRLTVTYFQRLRGIGRISSRGGLNIANNSMLWSISGFNALSYLWGSVDLSGNIRGVFIGTSSIAHGFHLNTTETGFNCVTFDRIPTTSYDGRPNFCIAMVNGKDTAIHEKPPSLITGDKLGAAIAVPIIAAILLLLVIMRCVQNRKRAEKQRRELAAAEERGGELELQDVDRRSETVRRQSDSDDEESDGAGQKLPKYRKEAKPGEAPPAYRETRKQVGATARAVD